MKTRDWSDEPIYRPRDDFEPTSYPTRPPIAIWILAGLLALLWRGRDGLIERWRRRSSNGS